MSNNQIEESARHRKHWVDAAISLAMQSKWEDAVSQNKQIIEAFPKDVEACNRLGRALTELGLYGEAREAYQRAVTIDPLNNIAQKNLARLSTLREERAPKPTHGRVDPRFFIAETGKTGVTQLQRMPNRAILAPMAIGDELQLRPDGRALFVENARNETIGQVEPKLAQRIIDLIKGGNRYAAAVMSLSDASARIIIRETYQHSSLVGKLSFPTKAEPGGVRAYGRDSLIKDYADEDDDDDFEGETAGEGESDESDDSIGGGDYEDDRSRD